MSTPRDMTKSRLDPEAIYRRLTLSQAAELLRRPQPPRSLLDAVADRLEAVERQIASARAAAQCANHNAQRIEKVLRCAASPTAEDVDPTDDPAYAYIDEPLDEELPEDQNDDRVDYDAWLAARALHRLIGSRQIGPIAADIRDSIEAIALGDISAGAYDVERLMLEFAHLVDLTAEQHRARAAGAHYPGD